MGCASSKSRPEPPYSIQETQDAYHYLKEPFESFVKQHCKVEPGAYILYSLLKMAFSDYCTTTNNNHYRNMDPFMQRLVLEQLVFSGVPNVYITGPSYNSVVVGIHLEKWVAHNMWHPSKSTSTLTLPVVAL